MPKLGVNVDHVATVRQARLASFPDPVFAALEAERAGADGIVVHLREDRRHIQERDVRLLREKIKTKLNLEMATNEEVIRFALKIKPDSVCIVPEKRKELTTEGGLDVFGQKNKLKRVTRQFREKGISVSLFIDPEIKQIEAAKFVSADAVELHTGRYADAKNKKERISELAKLEKASKIVLGEGIILNAGHGLDYQNVLPVARIPGMHDLNIGFSIIGRAIFVGIYQAVKEMKKLITEE
jgi:pyridoxine 5-phosphate synthase